jgi:hypothetical protein
MGRVHDVLMRDDMLGLSTSALDRYLGSPVSFLVSLAMRFRTIDERVSLITRMTSRTYNPDILRRIFKEILRRNFLRHTWHAPIAPTANQGVDWQLWAPQTLTRGQKRILMKTQTETSAIHVWNIYQQGSVTASILPYSCGCHMSAMLPPTKDAPVEPKTPCSVRDTITSCIFGALPVMSARLLQGLHDNLQCIHNFCEHK